MANAFWVHIIVPAAEGPISVQRTAISPGGTYQVLCDPHLGLPTVACEHALTNHPPAATCEKCKAIFRQTLRAKDPDPEIEETPPIEV